MGDRLSDLLARKAELERQIIEAQREQKAEAIARVRQLMNEHGLSLADLSARPAPPRKAAAAAKVPAKYRNKDTGETWSGRGLQPKWLRNALAAGRTIDEFAL
ncbi:MAG TPA: H-NS histone family protein [Rubrivivax sp.]|jgi:DNA-binding protein H-NS|nr:H-NS histone family protein [Rubrivivax sp.]